MINLDTYLELPINQEERYLMEMANIGSIDNKLVAIIRMNDPGNVPHFHMVDKVTLGRDFHTCIKIESPEYFHHEGKEDVLNGKQRKNLNDFLKNKNELGVTNWKYLVTTWNINNSNKKVDKDITQPDYTKLK